VDIDENTGLHIACRKDDLDTARELLDNGAGQF
jgi:ankyrin repeat protein